LAFWTIAKTGSIARAAKSMHITPSAMSHALKSLEEELDSLLFERRGHRAFLTAAGQRLLPRVERVLEEMRLAREEVLALNQWGRGALRLGASGAACEHFLPDVLLEFRECFPECELDVSAMDAPVALAQLRGGALDLAITVADGKPPEIEMQPLFSDELVVVVSTRHPWASLQRLTHKELEGQRLMINNRESASANLVRRHLESIGVGRVSFLTLGSIEAMKEMARVGLCPAIVAPWVVERDIEAGTLAAVRMGGPQLRRQWAALWPEHRPLGITAQVFIGLCRDVTAIPPFGRPTKVA
jgi:DNA-binding transcriptional LysR family regulator